VREIEISVERARRKKAEKARVEHGPSSAGSGMSKRIAGYGKELVYLRDDDDADEKRADDHGLPKQRLRRDVAEGSRSSKASTQRRAEGLDVAAGSEGLGST